MLLKELCYIHTTEYNTKKWLDLHEIWTNLKDALSEEKLITNCAVCFTFCNNMREKNPCMYRSGKTHLKLLTLAAFGRGNGGLALS